MELEFSATTDPLITKKKSRFHMIAFIIINANDMECRELELNGNGIHDRKIRNLKYICAANYPNLNTYTYQL